MDDEPTLADAAFEMLIETSRQWVEHKISAPLSADEAYKLRLVIVRLADEIGAMASSRAPGSS